MRLHLNWPQKEYLEWLKEKTPEYIASSLLYCDAFISLFYSSPNWPDKILDEKNWEQYKDVCLSYWAYTKEIASPEYFANQLFTTMPNLLLNFIGMDYLDRGISDDNKKTMLQELDISWLPDRLLAALEINTAVVLPNLLALGSESYQIDNHDERETRHQFNPKTCRLHLFKCLWNENEEAMNTFWNKVAEYKDVMFDSPHNSELKEYVLPDLVEYCENL